MRTRIEKAIALIRQGHSVRAIEILENICGGLPYEKEEAEEQPETLELEETIALKEVTKDGVRIPSFFIHTSISGDTPPELQIDDEKWDFDVDWMNSFISKMRKEYKYSNQSPEAMARLAREALVDAVLEGKVWRR